MRNGFRYILFFILCCLVLNVHAQKKSFQLDSLNGIWLEGKMQLGSVFPHKTSVTYVLDRNLVGFDVTLTSGSKGRHLWEQLYRYPRYGIGYGFLNLGNPEVLGNIHSFYGLIDVPFHKPKDRFNLSYQVNFGLGYFTKTFDSYDNPLNHIVSSPYNVYIGLDFSGRFKVGKKNELKAAVELTHCSNGKTRSPNQGINAVTFSAAYVYALKEPYTPKIINEQREYRKHFVEIVGNIGGKRDDNLNEDVFMISSLILDYHFAYSPKYAVGLGMDGFYDASLSQHQEYFEGMPRNDVVNYQLGMHLGFRARFGNMFVLLNAGHYLIHDYIRHGPVYSRIGLRYAVTDQILLNLTLKAHNTIADFIEWGVGYRFKTNGI